MSALPSPDPAPVAAAAHGLYERNASRIFGFCFNRLENREDAEDAVQSTFLNAFRALRRGVVPQAEAAWLFKIAENVCRERRRSARRRPQEMHDPLALERAASPSGVEDDGLLGLSDALARMAPRQRQALLLREWQGLSYREIGDALELTPAAVETLIFRARRSLAQNLDEPERLRSRLRIPALHAGALLGWAKSLLPGGTAATKLAAAGVVVAGVTLGGGAPAPAPDRDRPTPTPAAVTASSTVAPPSAGGADARTATARPRSLRRGGSGVRYRRPATPNGGAASPAARPELERALPSSRTAEAPPAPTPPPAAPPAAAAPPAPPSPLPELPQPQSVLPLSPPPTLPQLPAAPTLPEVPDLPATPTLPAVPPLPPAPELPGLPG